MSSRARLAALACAALVSSAAAAATNRAPAILVMMHHAVEGAPQATARMNHFALPDPRLRARLKAKGFEVGVAPYAPGLTLDFLKQFNVVVVPHPYLPGFAPDLDDMAAAKKQLLLDYVKAGGGLLAMRVTGWQYGKDIDEYNRWLAPLDITVLSEQVVDDEYSVTLDSRYKLSWTDNLADHPVTEGVGGIFYTTYFHGYSDSMSPLRVGPDWTVLLRGKSTTKSLKTFKGGKPPQPEPGTYASEPPLLAVRTWGKGRVAVWPLNSTLVWQDGYHRLWGGGVAMEGKAAGMAGDAARLLENMVAYLAAPTRGVFGGFAPPPQDDAKPEPGFVKIDWDNRTLRGAHPPHCFMGLIGARSELSSGTGKPEAFIAAAREAGYDFIAFTEDLDRLTEASFARLKAVCRDASTDTFKAYPGYLYLDESGNTWATFADRVRWPEKDWWSTKHPGRIKVNNPVSRGCQWPPVILVHPHRNPEKPSFQGNFKVLSVYTYDDNQLVDDALDVYLRLQRMSFQLCPVAVHLVDAPEEVRAARGNGFQTHVRWFDHNMVEALAGHIARHQGNYVHFRSCFVSEGPILESGRILNFATSDLAIPTNDRFRLHVRASSPAGVREVTILNSDVPRPWRRFLPGGEKTFEATIDHFHDRQYGLVLQVIDANGKRALGWNMWTGVQENSYPRCSDNLNTMPRGKWWGQPKNLQNVRGIENYLAVRNFRYAGLPVFTGLPESSRPAVQFYPVLACRFGTILDCIVEDHYPPTATGNSDKTDNPERAVPNEVLGGRVRHTLFTPWQDGSLIMLVDGRFEARQAVSLQRCQVMGFHGREGADCVVATRPDGTVLCGKLDERARGYADVLPRGGYAAAFPQPYRGAVGVVALQEGLRYRAFRAPGAIYCNFRGELADEGRALAKGDVVAYRYLGVMGALDAAPDSRFITDIVGGLGIGGDAAYRVTPRTGQVLDTEFVLRLAAADHGFAGRITEAKLPLCLPVTVTGLNPRWHAGIWYPGRQKLWIAEWVVNDMNQRWTERRVHTVDDAIHHFPVLEDGLGFLQVNTYFGDKDVFIGNLLVADCPDVCLTLVDRRPGKAAFVVHNPTDEAVACHVQPGPGFTLLGDFRKEVTVPAGSSVRMAVP